METAQPVEGDGDLWPSIPSIMDILVLGTSVLLEHRFISGVGIYTSIFVKYTSVKLK